MFNLMALGVNIWNCTCCLETHEHKSLVLHYVSDMCATYIMLFVFCFTAETIMADDCDDSMNSTHIYDVTELEFSFSCS